MGVGQEAEVGGARRAKGGRAKRIRRRSLAAPDCRHEERTTRGSADAGKAAARPALKLWPPASTTTAFS